MARGQLNAIREVLLFLYIPDYPFWYIFIPLSGPLVSIIFILHFPHLEKKTGGKQENAGKTGNIAYIRESNGEQEIINA